MAVTMRLMSLIVASCGIVSFVFGVIAENKKVKSTDLLIQGFTISLLFYFIFCLTWMF
jgi:hypothetical protein